MQQGNTLSTTVPLSTHYIIFPAKVLLITIYKRAKVLVVYTFNSYNIGALKRAEYGVISQQSANVTSQLNGYTKEFKNKQTGLPSIYSISLSPIHHLLHLRVMKKKSWRPEASADVRN